MTKVYTTTHAAYMAQLRKAQPEIDRIRREAIERFKAQGKTVTEIGEEIIVEDKSA